ncbi:MAG: DMT family transporter [Pseudomonadota bacterium]
MPDRDWIIIFILGIGWGATFFFNEMILRDVGPVTVSFLRVALAAVACWIYLFATRQFKPVRAPMLAALALFGVLMFAFPFAIYPLGQQYVASGIAGIVNALTPVMVVIVSHFWPGGERATPLKSLGVLAGFAGIVLLTLPAMAPGQETLLFGTLVIVLAPISYAFAMNYFRRFHTLGAAVITAWAFTFATLALIPVMLFTEGVPRGLQASTIGSTVFLGVVLTAIAFLAAFTILPRAGATKTSTVTFIAPISAILIGKLVLDEVLTAAHFAGMAAIFLGLLLIDGRLFQRRRAEKLN